MRFNSRLFWILLSAGFAGVASFLLVDLEALIALLPKRPGMEIPEMTTTLKLLSLVQPSLFLAVAVAIGVVLAPKVGLSAPVAEALANGGDKLSPLKPQIFPGIVGGLLAGISIVVIAAAFNAYLPVEVVRLVSEFGKILPLPTRLLYGGVTEELLLRWGFMTVLVWVAWRFVQRGEGAPKRLHFILAIVVSSVVFGIGHLPVAFMLVPEPTLALVLFVITANSAFGIFGGQLYWRRGLESAMIAHAVTHIVLFTARYFQAYF